MIKVLNGRLERIDRREALHYLGLTAKDIPEEQTTKLLDECEAEALRAQDLRAVYSIYGFSADGDELDLGFAKAHSHSLALNLAGCNKIVLFACTAGIGIDRLIAAYSRISPSKAAAMQALGAALVEGWCDEIHAMCTREYGANRSRFSCGYGDLPLTLQRDIFAALSVTKRIGITLSDNCFMTPSKSVTAIIGIKQNKG